jgi:hypothetical protein
MRFSVLAIQVTSEGNKNVQGVGNDPSVILDDDNANATKKFHFTLRSI